MSRQAPSPLEMQHIRQPTENSCGQTCLAMYLGVSVETVLKDLPDRKRGTYSKEAINYLRRQGVRCADRLTSAHQRVLPKIALVRIVWPNKKGHLVLKVGESWFDPLLPAPFYGTLPPTREWSGGGRVASFLELP